MLTRYLNTKKMYNNKACHGISDNLVNLKYTYTEYRRFL